MLSIQYTHRSPILGTRKPDFVFILKDSKLDYLNVVAVGEIKKPTSGNDAQIGQAISFSEKLLQLRPRRRFAFVILTDCIQINIYKVHRIDDREKSITLFKYEYIAPQTLKYNTNKNNGWKYLVTLMKSTPETLKWVKPSLKFGSETVNLVGAIGMGRTSIVYKGKHNSKSVAVKIARKVEYLHCFERERSALVLLSELNSPHIAKILFYNEDALVMTPRGEKGYCTLNIEDTEFAGVLECMLDEVLNSLIKGGKIVYEEKVDLICFVRSFYLMLHRPSLNRPSFDKDDNIKKRAKRLLEFWCIHGKSDVWDSIYNAIKCNQCKATHFKNDFDKWTSGSKTIDKFIQDAQLNATRMSRWIDGYIRNCNVKTLQWERDVQCKVALKKIDGIGDINEDFLNEMAIHLKIIVKANPSIRFYGITKDPENHKYMMVLDYLEGENLWDYLNIIHEPDIFHQDFHPGNILSLSDFGLSKLIGKNVENPQKRNVFEVLPYMAPELLELALKICNGLRSKIPFHILKLITQVIMRCWDTRVTHRLTFKELYDVLNKYHKDYLNYTSHVAIQVKKAKELSKNQTTIDTTLLIYKTHPQAIYTSRLNFSNLPKPKRKKILKKNLNC
ncbi:hypothetical protein Glove_71g2 [Diversispora epigaea]|uniref:Protein kinase domain-containing protein n=1 Tax=Diversispora epigaea TaxID=1348612 RepID=A0A397JGR4_9GLOM|nr:hypothetical protein Glove_71g2 [Diversispora epigaea]